MDTAIGTPRADKQAAFTPKRGKVKPIDIFSVERRKTDEDTVAKLDEALARDGRFLQDIGVRDEGANGYRLIFGANRLEAWKRHFGKLRPIPADIYPTDTPDALITIHEIEENLRRKELTAEERQRKTLLLAAALKEFNGWKPPTAVSDAGEAVKTGTMSPSLGRARGGRGKKGMAQKLAEKTGIRKRSVNRIVEAASAAIGEPIDLDHDTPEELKRKAAELEVADKRQRAEAKVVRLKRPKPEPRGATEDPTQPAKLRAADIGSKIEDLWKDLDAMGRIDAIARKEQRRLIHKFCLGLGLEPPKMARPAAFGLVEEESELAVDLPAEVAPTTDDAPGAHAEQQDNAADVGTENLQHPGDAVSQAADEESEVDVELPAEVAPATDAVAEQAEHGDEAAVAHAEEHDEAAAVQANQGDNGAEFGAEDLQDAGDDVPDAADPEIGVTKCAHCKEPFSSVDLPRMKYGRLYHRKLCVDHAKPIAIAA